MPWLRAGDNAATHPKVMAAVSLDPYMGIVNEVFGFFTRCMTMGAGHMTDYVVDAGTVFMIGGGRAQAMIDICVRLGLMTPTEVKGLPAYVMYDEPEFLHMRLRAEVEWERQRKRDTGNPKMAAPVRLRDGDECRWCGVVTFWGTADKRGNRVGTIDHLKPGQPGTVDTMVVACRGCNSSRKDDAETWTKTLLPEPIKPFYCKATADYVYKHLDKTVPVSSPARPGYRPDDEPERPDSQSDTAPRPAQAGTARSDRQPPAPRTDDTTGSTDPQGTEPGNAGSGRDGSGRAGKAGEGRAGGRRRSRGRRGRSARGET